jgi:hypothetical protein
MLYEKISGFSDEIAEDIDTQFAMLNKLGISYFEPRGVNGKNISTLNDAEVEELTNDGDTQSVEVIIPYNKD